MLSSPGIVENADTLTQAAAVRKVMWRLIPATMVLYLLNYLDRVNVAFAKLQMNQDLGFSDAVYGLGTSIFFVGYFIFEVPSNLIMQKVGARAWIARIMISWGLVSALMAFTTSPTMFYALRFCLGAAEAGFFPAIILYLTYWIPAAQRAQAGAWFLTSLAMAGVVGGPIAGTLLGLNGFGFVGWQWLFLAEGIPTILVGFLVLAFLPNTPDSVQWLSAAEKKCLSHAISEEHKQQRHDAGTLKFAFFSPMMWALSALYGLMIFGFYALGYWTPSIIKAVTHGSNAEVGWLSALPFAAAIVGMLWIAKFTDRSHAKLHVAAASLTLGAIGLGAAAYATSALGIVLTLSVAAVGVYGALAPFWTVPPTFLRGSAAAAGIAIINSIGNLGGGLIGPNVIGQLKERSHTYSSGLIVSAAVLGAAVVLCLVIGTAQRRGNEGPLATVRE